MVVFWPQDKAESFTPDEGAVIVSITDPCCPLADLNDGWLDVLRVQFHDIEEPLGDRFELMSDQTAHQIICFAEKIAKYPPSLVVVHCKAGASRSAAVASIFAAGLGLCLQGNPESYNHHVFRCLKKAAMKRFALKPSRLMLRIATCKSPA